MHMEGTCLIPQRRRHVIAPHVLLREDTAAQKLLVRESIVNQSTGGPGSRDDLGMENAVSGS